MVGGRLFGDRINDAIGVKLFLIIQSSLAAVACFILFQYSGVWSSVLGFSLAGLGVANLVPVAYSQAGKSSQINTASAIVIISIFSYGAFMLGPAVEGVIADHYGLPSIFLPLLAFFLVAITVTQLFAVRSLGIKSI